jgi:hypothetical protein
MATYSEKLRDPRWQKKRLEIMQRDGFRCQECTDDSTTLHVHHTRYVKGREPWEYSNGFLVTLCEKCHENMHDDPTSVIEHLTGSLYEHGASWSVLWELCAVLDFGLPRLRQLSYLEWAEVFRAVDAKFTEILARSANGQD